MSRVGDSVDRLEATALDDGGVLVTGRLPGPAGLATVLLLDGAAELAVDVVEHDALVWLRLDAPTSPDAVRLARFLLGPLAAGRLVGSLGASGPIWDRATDEGDLDRWGQRDGLGLGSIGRLAVALAELGDPHLDERAVAIGLVEAGLLALEVGPEPAPRPSGLDLVRAGVARWEALGPGARIEGDPALLARVVELGDAATAAVAADVELADALAELVADLARLLGDPPVAAAGGARHRLRPPEPQEPVVLEVRSLPTAPAAAPAAKASLDRAAAADRAAPPEVAIEVAFSADLGARLIGVEHDGHHLRVHLGGVDDDAPEPWLRVFAAGARPTPVALAPFPESGRPWRTAVALVPPGLPGSQLLVDVTTSPAEPWMAPSARALARATHLGAAAARAGRLADLDAQERWDACAEAWDDLGDEPRADAARAFADVRDPVALGPLLVDQLR